MGQETTDPSTVHTDGRTQPQSGRVHDPGAYRWDAYTHVRTPEPGAAEYTLSGGCTVELNVPTGGVRGLSTESGSGRKF